MPFKFLHLLLPAMFLKFSVDGEDGGGAPVDPKPAKPSVESFSREYVQELRHENASYRTKAAEEARKSAEADERVKQVQLEADTKVTAATTSANERIIRAELKAAALKAGMVDMDGLKLADLSTIKLSEAGEVEGAEKLMEEMKKAKPYLFGTTTTTTSTQSAPRAADSKQKLATEMTAEEYAEQRANIRRGILPKFV